MNINEQVRLKFYGIDIANVEFNSQQSFLSIEDKAIQIDIVPKVFYPEGENKHFSILMNVLLKVEDYFELKVFAIGAFELEREVNTEIKKGFINVNAPAIMFPYVRSFISTFTASLGNATGTIIIPPQAFSGELETFDNSESQQN